MDSISKELKDIFIFLRISGIGPTLPEQITPDFRILFKKNQNLSTK
jgi:hypothetical protein